MFMSCLESESFVVSNMLNQEYNQVPKVASKLCCVRPCRGGMR